MDSRAAMTYHLGNALLHLQYLAGHMPWFVPPADIAPAPASLSAATTPGLTTFVPHPGRPSYSASSSRPLTEYTISPSTIDGQPGVLIGPPSTRDPVSSSSGLAPPAASTAPAATPVSEPRPPPRGLSISRSPPIPLSRHHPLTDSTSPPPTGNPVPPSIATTPSAPLDSSSTPTVHPVHPPSPVMAPERRSKRRRVASTWTTSRPSDSMPPPLPPASESSHPPPDSSNPSVPSMVHISGHVLPITDSPPRDPPASSGEPGTAPSSDSDDSQLSTRPPSPPGGEGTPASATTGPARPLADLCRNWAPVDDNELITYKKDTKARPSWKTIGQRLHRSAESCRARWLWLQSTGRVHTNVLVPPRNTEE
eukprot:s521_g32.t1